MSAYDSGEFHNWDLRSLFDSFDLLCSLPNDLERASSIPTWFYVTIQNPNKFLLFYCPYNQLYEISSEVKYQQGKVYYYAKDSCDYPKVLDYNRDRGGFSNAISRLIDRQVNSDYVYSN